MPKAIRLPANETEPTTAENITETAATAPRDVSPSAPWAWYSETAISAAAPPPRPFKSATSCGIAVICTRRAITAPIEPPTTAAITIHA